MLLNLHVKNFAIIEDINIDFYEGLNIISGETGAGKSILLKSLNLIKGEKFNKEYLGIFGEKTYVEAVFSSNDEINSLLENEDFDVDDNVIISRTFTSSSSISKINGKSCSVNLLSKVSNLLFDVHGQHSQLVVLNKNNYLNLIDKFDENTVPILSEIRENLLKISKLKIELENLELSESEVEREKDILHHQINEIEEFDFEKYDEESLNNEYSKLSNKTKLISISDSILADLSQSSRSLTLKELSHKIYTQFLTLNSYDKDTDKLLSDALNIKELINDLSNDLYTYSSTLEVDDERLMIIEDIFSSFQNLKNKYGRDTEEIKSFLNNIKNRYDLLTNISKVRNSTLIRIEELNKNLLELSEKLTKIRKNIISYLEDKILNELKEMNMNNIDFKIELKSLENVNKMGIDEIDFLISTNKGQELKSLSQVSSGGEISRFMLALKAALVEKEEIGCIIFDEIDTGISGKTADIVGNKLKKISQNTQLIVISHLAQIASKANSHYLIKKEVVDEVTKTSVFELDDVNRITEIARLISGQDITQNSIETAKELLKENV